MAEKVTRMVLKVDLQCCKCYKKVKKVLCKFPQIQDQVYDEKNNKVMIKVVSCCPEKIRDKLCCKGRGCIKSIEILEPPKAQPPVPKGQPAPPKPEQPPPPKDKEKPIDTPKPADKPKEKPADPPKSLPSRAPAPGYPPLGPVLVGLCCTDCYQGHGGGPCYNPCYGQPVRYYDGYYGRPVYDSWGGGGGLSAGDSTLYTTPAA